MIYFKDMMLALVSKYLGKRVLYLDKSAPCAMWGHVFRNSHPRRSTVPQVFIQSIFQYCHKQKNAPNYQIAQLDVCLFDYENNPPNVQFSFLKKHSNLNAKDMLISIIIEIVHMSR